MTELTHKQICSKGGLSGTGKAKTRDKEHYTVILPKARKEALRLKLEKEKD